MKIVLASSNSGKLKEIQQILSPLPFECVPQTTLKIEDIPETGLSFVENAILKARHAAKASQLPAIADDSGLCVEALQGQPGIYSARFAGEKATSEQNIEKLLELMKPYQGEARRARFFATIVLIQHAADPIPIICQAAWEGILLTEPRGKGGFGYDPIFYIPELELTAAELKPELKNQLSHRGKALSQLLHKLQFVY
ncbi:MAG: RdgB/HAM1 family non-canonical purine NTP pyrophosphatase [Gammaproteobacteria bacterium]